ncbi:MAG: ABC transporter ATP-binding protein [Calditrichaeota bacterium]|nr:ABC transporter ATP-binding protein [Calditrichota bacterium]
MALLDLNNLSRHFGGVKAVEQVSLAVAQSSIHGLIGPNGSGKTTLFNCLTGVYRPTSGQVMFSGRRIDGAAPHIVCGYGIARTFQNLRLFAGMTVLENVLVGRHRHLKVNLFNAVIGGVSVQQEHNSAVHKALELLAFCGLTAKADYIASSLPYGLQRRLEIARALATEPKLLLLDEPAAGMNPAEADDLKILVHRIRERGITVFIIEHNVRLVMGLCERVSVMDAGRLIADDTPDDIARNPAVIEAYLGKGNE